MNSFCPKLDQFGVMFQPTIQKDQVQFRSAFGGIASVLIYACSFAYFIYVMYQWISGDILPKITSSQKLIDYSAVTFNNIFELKIQNIPEIDPFSQTNNILTPFMFEVKGQGFDKFQTIFPSSLEPIVKGQSSVVRRDNMELVLNFQKVFHESSKQNTQIFIGVMRCQSAFLNEGQTCADDTTIKNYLKTPLMLINFQINLKEFDIETKSFNTIPKQMYFVLDDTSLTYNQVLLKTTQTSISNGILFPIPDKHDYVSNVELMSQTLRNDYFNLLNVNSVYAGFLLRIDTFQEYKFISYPQLGEVMAIVGAIVSILMSLQGVVIFINKQLLEKYIVDEIISFYYPQFSDLLIRTGKGGKVMQVQSKKTNQNFDPDPIQRFYDNMKVTAKKKLNILNLLYEMSRMQFVLHSLQLREQLQQSRNIGLKIPLKALTKPKGMDNSKVNIQENLEIVNLQEEFVPTVRQLVQDDIDIFLKDFDRAVLKSNTIDNEYYKANYISD